MDRRQALCAVTSLLVCPFASQARAQARAVRIGFLAPRQRSVFLPSIVKRFSELGYTEGKNLKIEYRSVDGALERFSPLARELIELKCDLIFAVGPEHPAQALLRAKTSIPVVLLAITYDPVKFGIVPNLRRPGGNITGMFAPLPDLAAKQLELLHETVPAAKRFLILGDTSGEAQIDSVRVAAKRLRLQILVEVFRGAPPYDLETAVQRARAASADAAVIIDSSTLFDQRQRLASVLMHHKLPSIVNVHYFDQEAFLLSYGVNFHTGFSRAADMAVRILRGANPGEIPLEQPTEFELAVNLATAKSFGIAVPGPVRARANRVIE